MSQGQAPYPVELRNHSAGRWLELLWSDGITAVLPHRLLREACRCASCRAAQREGRNISAAGVSLDRVEPYGANVLRLVFDDGHDRGLYPFAYLRELPSASNAAAQQEKLLAKPSSSSGLR